MIWLAGFIMGAVVTFIVTAAFVWKPRIDELDARWKEERERRIVAEDNARHDARTFDWGPPPIPDPNEPSHGLGFAAQADARIVDLTGVDDVPSA